jgi:hypothetical protein
MDVCCDDRLPGRQPQMRRRGLEWERRAFEQTERRDRGRESAIQDKVLRIGAVHRGRELRTYKYASGPRRDRPKRETLNLDAA